MSFHARNIHRWAVRILCMYGPELRGRPFQNAHRTQVCPHGGLQEVGVYSALRVAGRRGVRREHRQFRLKRRSERVEVRRTEVDEEIDRRRNPPGIPYSSIAGPSMSPPARRPSIRSWGSRSE